MLNLRGENQRYIYLFKLSWVYIKREPIYLVMKYSSLIFSANM